MLVYNYCKLREYSIYIILYDIIISFDILSYIILFILFILHIYILYILYYFIYIIYNIYIYISLTMKFT